MYEILTISPEIRDLIRAQQPSSVILEVARKYDFMKMREDGILKALKGETTLEEVFKVME